MVVSDGDSVFLVVFAAAGLHMLLPEHICAVVFALAAAQLSVDDKHRVARFDLVGVILIHRQTFEQQVVVAVGHKPQNMMMVAYRPRVLLADLAAAAHVAHKVIIYRLDVGNAAVLCHQLAVEFGIADDLVDGRHHLRAVVVAVGFAVCQHLFEDLGKATQVAAGGHFQTGELHGQLAAHVFGARLFARLLLGQFFGQLVHLLVFVGDDFVFGLGGVAAFAQGGAEFVAGHAVNVVQRVTIDVAAVS